MSADLWLETPLGFDACDEAYSIAALAARQRTPESGRWVRYECEVPVISRSVFDPPRRRTVEGWAWARYAPAPDESASDHDAEPRVSNDRR